MNFFLILAFIQVVAATACITQFSCFKTKLFNFQSPQSGYYQINNFLTLNSTPIISASYGDFNNDLMTDIVFIDSSQTYYIYTWNVITNSFQPGTSSNCIQNCTAIFAIDINSDGYLDFVTYYESGASGYLTNFIRTPGQTLTFTTTNNSFTIDAVQPFIVDIQIPIDYRQQFLAQISGNRVILSYDQTSSFNITPWSTYFNSNSSYQSVNFSIPHQNSFLDFTGDCQADILIMSDSGSNYTFQFWIRNQKYNLSGTLNVSKTNFVGLSFIDIDYDGGIDFMYIANNMMYIYKNKRPIGSSNDFCASNLNNLPYLLQSSPDQVIDLSQYNPRLMQAIHFGDVTSDGYPQLLFLDQNNHLKLLVNNGGSSFDQDTDLSKVIPNSTYNFASFFDILENGIYDFMMISQSGQFQSVFNNQHNPSFFFLKGYSLYGPDSNLGSLYSGASFFWVNTIDSNKKYSHLPQLFQSSYNAQQLPYVLNGLGRANNYVQQFYVGISSKSGGASYRTWTPIIPNSQLAIFTDSSSKTWNIKIFVLPTQNIVYVVIVTIVILVILGAILLGFYWKTKKKDDLLLV